MAIIWDEQTFQFSYQVQVGDQSVTYGREWASAIKGSSPEFEHFMDRWKFLSEYYKIAPEDRILVIGSAFGFLVEVAHDAGYPNVWCNDGSAWIQSEWSKEARDDVGVLFADIRDLPDFTDLTGGNVFDWIITEDILTSYTVNEMAGILDSCERYLASGHPLKNIIHLVSLHGAPLFTIMSLEEWEAVRPSHNWVSPIQVANWVHGR